MPGFSSNAVKISFYAPFMDGMVIAPFIIAKHKYYDNCTNVHRSYYHINPACFDRLDADHTWKKIV